MNNLNFIIPECSSCPNQIDNGEAKNHGTKNSGPTLKTPESMNRLKILNFLLPECSSFPSQIDDGESKNYGTKNSGPTL